VTNPAAFILYLLESVIYQGGEAAAALSYTSISQCRHGNGKGKGKGKGKAVTL